MNREKNVLVTTGILLMALLFGVMLATVVNAAPPASEVEAIRAVLEENFQATTHEDLPRLMNTISSQAPDRDLFAKESQEVFNRTDVYVRLDEFQLTGWRPPYAAARVVQTTLPKDEDDRQEGNVYYADNSALLTTAETVEYTQVFLKERGKWKVHEITSRPRKIATPATAGCPDGNCRLQKSGGSPFR